MAEISAGKQERQHKVAELFRKGLDSPSIAAALNLKDYTIRHDLRELGLVDRARNLDRTQAFELADAGTPWREAATQLSISHSQFCKWMKESGRKPPAKKSSKQHLKPQAFAMHDEGKSWDEICSTIGIASATLSQWLRSRGRTNTPSQPQEI